MCFVKASGDAGSLFDGMIRGQNEGENKKSCKNRKIFPFRSRKNEI